jgi:hypothetical protein
MIWLEFLLFMNIESQTILLGSLRTLESAITIERKKKLYIILTLIVSDIDNRFTVKEYAVVYYRKIRARNVEKTYNVACLSAANLYIYRFKFVLN